MNSNIYDLHYTIGSVMYSRLITKEKAEVLIKDISAFVVRRHPEVKYTGLLLKVIDNNPRQWPMNILGIFGVDVVIYKLESEAFSMGKRAISTNLFDVIELINIRIDNVDIDTKSFHEIVAADDVFDIGEMCEFINKSITQHTPQLSSQSS